MSVSLTSNFLRNARGLTLSDANGVTWSINKNTNAITATVTGGAGLVPANPIAKVGLAAVNGSATTYMRSDGAPPIDQAIAPTWTGLHTFTASFRNEASTQGTGPGGSSLTFDFAFTYAPGQLYLVSRGAYDSTGLIYSHRASVWCETSSGAFVEGANRLIDSQGGSATVTTDTVTRSGGNIVVTVNIGHSGTTFTNYASVIQLT